MKILLVEDDAGLAGEVADALRREGFAVDHAANGEDAAHLGLTEPYAAAVLDLGLPDIDGLEVLTRWRVAGRQLAVLILTARDDWTSKAQGFKAGADDYLLKPFRTEELILRLRALIRRASAAGEPRIQCGDLAYEPQSGQFSFQALPLRLTALEWRVLTCLILRKDAVVTRADLVDRVYEGDGGSDSNSLDVIVGRLRRKIGADLIETVRGRGYRLTTAPQPRP